MHITNEINALDEKTSRKIETVRNEMKKDLTEHKNSTRSELTGTKTKLTTMEEN